MKQFPNRIEIITLGCSKNLVDSEQLHYQLAHAGYDTGHNSEFDAADIAVVNTCGFVNDAKEESIETILNLVEKKNAEKLRKIVVFGCLAQRYMEELQHELPEVDTFIGNFDMKALLSELMVKPPYLPAHRRVLDNPGHYAYLKIAEGCNRKCSFCAIPGFKGKYISRSIDDVCNEAASLAASGVKELMLIAQDTSFYGYDRARRYLLPDLLNELVTIQGIEWIRIHYLYPSAVTRRLIETVAEHEKICNYFDIPLQHISDEVLRNMKRNTSKADIVKILTDIRHIVPDACLRTTFIVGFPGETRKQFNELLSFVRGMRFDRVGAFSYSHEENTYGARHFADTVTARTKLARLDSLMAVQQQISLEKNAAKVGKVVPVMVDGNENGLFVGRTASDSVEVDNTVWIDPGKNIQVGHVYPVYVYDSAEFDLFGRIV